MKTVRYIAGAAGLAPLALGVAFPATAHASVPRKAPVTGKTVSLTAALTPRIPAFTSGCTTSRTFSIPANGNLRGHGWQRDGDSPNYTEVTICVGTQVASVKFNAGVASNPYCKYVWVSQHINSIFGANKSYYKPAHQHECAYSHPIWKITDFGIHKTWWNSGLYPIESSLRVNMFSTNDTTGNGQWLH